MFLWPRLEIYVAQQLETPIGIMVLTMLQAFFYILVKLIFFPGEVKPFYARICFIPYRRIFKKIDITA